MKKMKMKSPATAKEYDLLRQLKNCPSIVDAFDFYDDQGVDVVILEYAHMSLMDLLEQKHTTYPMQERVAKTILSQILRGIKAIHCLGFVHKDIKPENILIFTNRSERKLIAKVADLGFATRADVNGLSFYEKVACAQRVGAKCGTPGYWPPELAAQISSLKYAFKMDVFSCGVTLYRMLCNDMPFDFFWFWPFRFNQKNGQKKLCKVQPNWEVISWIQSDGKYTPVLSSRKLSDVVKDLLRSMLRIRPEQRANVDACLEHSFLGSSKSQKRHHHKLSLHNWHKSKVSTALFK